MNFAYNCNSKPILSRYRSTAIRFAEIHKINNNRARHRQIYYRICPEAITKEYVKNNTVAGSEVHEETSWHIENLTNIVYLLRRTLLWMEISFHLYFWTRRRSDITLFKRRYTSTELFFISRHVFKKYFAKFRFGSKKYYLT